MAASDVSCSDQLGWLLEHGADESRMSGKRALLSRYDGGQVCTIALRCSGIRLFVGECYPVALRRRAGWIQVAAIETAQAETDIFASSTAASGQQKQCPSLDEGAR